MKNSTALTIGCAVFAGLLVCLALMAPVDLLSEAHARYVVLFVMGAFFGSIFEMMMCSRNTARKTDRVERELVEALVESANLRTKLAESQKELQQKKAACAASYDEVLSLKYGPLQIHEDFDADTGSLKCEDLSKGAFVLGTKSAPDWIYRLAREWVEKDKGGALFMDAGDGSLPKKLHAAGLVDVLVHPGSDDSVKINLMKSMNPQWFAIALADVFLSKEKDSHFIMAGRSYVLAAASLVSFAAEREIAGVKLTFCYLATFVNVANERERVLALIASDHKAELRTNFAMKTEFDQWAVSYPSLPNETRGRLNRTLDMFFKDVVENERIASAVCDEGMDIAEQICRGKRVGIVISEEDGMGGLLVLALIKAAVFSRMKKRAQDRDWRAEGERDVLVMMDGSNSLLGRIDEWAAQGMRSFGLHLAYRCVSYDEVASQMGGEPAARRFISNFRALRYDLRNPLSGEAKP